MSNRMLDNGDIELSRIVKIGDLDKLKLLLKDHDPNGKTMNGLPQSIPMTAIDFSSSNWRTILNTLLLHGADINGEDIHARTVLIQACYENNYEAIEYILKRGGNPNGTIFHNPYYILKYLHSDTKMLDMLIIYGAVSLSFYDLSTYNIINVNIPTSTFYTPEIAIFYKLKNNDLQHNIKYLHDHKDSIDYDHLKELRQKKYPLKPSVNESTLYGNDLYEFLQSELIEYTDGKLSYYFHKSEIPLLLHQQSNPYTNQPFTEDFINELVDTDYIPQRTLEEMISPTEETVKYSLLSQLDKCIKVFNVYIQTDIINSFTLQDLIELQNLLHNGDDILISQIPHEYRKPLRNETGESTLKRIREATIIMILKHIQKNNSSNVAGIIIEQVYRDNNTVRAFFELFQPDYRKILIKQIKLGFLSYDNLISNISKFIDVMNKSSTPKSFKNTLSEDQLSVLEFIDNLEFLNLYSIFLIENINSILRERSSDNPRITFKELQLAFLRYVEN